MNIDRAKIKFQKENIKSMYTEMESNMYQSLTCKKQKFKTFAEELKVNFKKINIEEERKKFIDYIANNVEILGYFSDEQLLKLLNYSESENARKRKILNEFNN